MDTLYRFTLPPGLFPEEVDHLKMVVEQELLPDLLTLSAARGLVEIYTAHQVLALPEGDGAGVLAIFVGDGVSRVRRDIASCSKA